MQDHALTTRLSVLATAIEDAGSEAFGELSPSAVAALMIIRKSEPIAIQDIAALVGLTHSATVRLVDRLEKDWLVRRLRRRGREVQVEATARGKRRARDLHVRRMERVEAIVAGLGDDARIDLSDAVDTLLTHLIATGIDPGRLFRFSLDDHGEAATDASTEVDRED